MIRVHRKGYSKVDEDDHSPIIEVYKGALVSFENCKLKISNKMLVLGLRPDSNDNKI
jgi:hypothetical protein